MRGSLESENMQKHNREEGEPIQRVSFPVSFSCLCGSGSLVCDLSLSLSLSLHLSLYALSAANRAMSSSASAGSCFAAAA
jgi:hypothetical protein